MIKHYGYKCPTFLIPPMVHNKNDNTYSNTRASQVTLVVKNPPANAGHIRDWDLTTQDSIPASGRSPGDGNGNLLQYSCLKNPYGQRILAGYSPCGHKVSDTTEATYPLQDMDSCTSILSSVQSLIVAGMGQKLHWLEGSRLQQTRYHSCHPSDFQLS